MILQLKFIEGMVGIVDWLVWILLYIRELLQPSPAIGEAYQGGEPLLPHMEVMKVQPALIDAVGDRGAIFLQKVHEWTQYNLKKQSKHHKHDGAMWTYNSYADWHKKHFPFWSESWFRANLPKLEKEGFLIATQDAAMCKKNEKAYRINYEKILSLVAYQNQAEGVLESSIPPTSKTSEGYEKIAHNNSTKTSNQTKLINQIQTSTPDARARSRHDDGDGVGIHDHDSGEISQGYGESVSDDTARLEPILELEETPPGSAPPPSYAYQELVDQMFHELDIQPDIGKKLIRDHTSVRCRAVINYMKRKNVQANSPSGWFIAELRHNRFGIPDEFAREGFDEWADIVKT